MVLWVEHEPGMRRMQAGCVGELLPAIAQQCLQRFQVVECVIHTLRGRGIAVLHEGGDQVDGVGEEFAHLAPPSFFSFSSASSRVRMPRFTASSMFFASSAGVGAPLAPGLLTTVLASTRLVPPSPGSTQPGPRHLHRVAREHTWNMLVYRTVESHCAAGIAHLFGTDTLECPFHGCRVAVPTRMQVAERSAQTEPQLCAYFGGIVWSILRGLAVLVGNARDFEPRCR